MNKPDNTKFEIFQGDALDVLAGMPEKSVQMCVTSPPYWGLRSYTDDKKEIGKEPIHDCSGWATGNPCGDCYVCHLVEVFRGVKLVLRDDGVCWLNLGDSYASNGVQNPGGHNGIAAFTEKNDGRRRNPDKWATMNNAKKSVSRNVPPGLKQKDLCMIPARIALALQADGWYLRSDVIWAKKNCMPESVTDRPTKSHEHIFLLAKSRKYFFDHIAVMDTADYDGRKNTQIKGSLKYTNMSYMLQPRHSLHSHGQDRWPNTDTDGIRLRHRRDVWQLKPRNFTGRHFATFPFELPEIAIKAGTSEKGCCPECGKCWRRVVEKGLTSHESETATKYKTGSASNRLALLRQKARQEGREYSNNTKTTGWQPSCECNACDPVPCTVLDPFCGSGTSGVVALSLFRRFIGIELNQGYIDEFILPRLEKEAGRYKQIPIQMAA